MIFVRTSSDYDVIDLRSCSTHQKRNQEYRNQEGQSRRSFHGFHLQRLQTPELEGPLCGGCQPVCSQQANRSAELKPARARPHSAVEAPVTPQG